MKCQYKGCKEDHTTHFALVELCDRHEGLIRKETRRFYDRTTMHGYQASEQSMRKHYMRIAHLIPWSKVRKGRLHEV